MTCWEVPSSSEGRASEKQHELQHAESYALRKEIYSTRKMPGFKANAYQRLKEASRCKSGEVRSDSTFALVEPHSISIRQYVIHGSHIVCGINYWTGRGRKEGHTIHLEYGRCTPDRTKHSPRSRNAANHLPSTAKTYIRLRPTKHISRREDLSR